MYPNSNQQQQGNPQAQGQWQPQQQMGGFPQQQGGMGQMMYPNQQMQGMSGMPGMQQGMPGMQQGMPGMQQGMPGMQPGAPGMPGMQQGMPGMQPGAPGMPGMQQGMPGMQPGMPGMQQGMPGMQQGMPGMQQMQGAQGGMSQTGAGQLVCPPMTLQPGMKYDQFVQLHTAVATSELGTIKLLLYAILETVYSNNPDGGRMWGHCLFKDQLDSNGEPRNMKRNTAYMQCIMKVKGTNFSGGIPASYLGGNPDNGYAFNYNHVIKALGNSTSDGSAAKIFIQSGGKDFPTPVALRKNNSGIWKVFEYSSIYTGVKPTSQSSGDF